MWKLQTNELVHLYHQKQMQMDTFQSINIFFFIQLQIQIGYDVPETKVESILSCKI